MNGWLAPVLTASILAFGVWLTSLIDDGDEWDD